MEFHKKIVAGMAGIMGLKICVLASGSSGNCTYISSDTTAILVDAGLSCRETLRRLMAIGVRDDNIKGICVTHEHDDHVSSLGALHRKLGAALYANSGTKDGTAANDKLAGLSWNIFLTGEPFFIGDLKIEPFSVPHDTYDPVGFVVSTGKSRAGIVTDMGMPTELIRTKLRNCQIVVVESNHDEPLLNDSSRPWVLKQRIKGWQGHLSNEQACQMLSDIAGPELKTVFLAHLSSECNKPDLALKLARKVLVQGGYPEVAVRLTYSDRPSDLVEC